MTAFRPDKFQRAQLTALYAATDTLSQQGRERRSMMLDQLERMEPMPIIVNKRSRDRCDHYLYDLNRDRHCHADRPRSYIGPMSICSDCPIFSEHDAMYENITGREVEPTYEWWYKQWVEGYHGLTIPYALERLLDYVTPYTRTERELVESNNKDLRRFPVLRRRKAVNAVAFVVAMSLGALLVLLVQFMLTWLGLL